MFYPIYCQNLLQRIDAISRRQLCTPTYSGPLVVQPQPQSVPSPHHHISPHSSIFKPVSAQTVPLSAPSSSHLAKSSTVLLLANPSVNIISPSFHNHQMVTIPMTSSLSDYVQRSFTDNERCRSTRKCIDLLAKVLGAYDPTRDDYRLLLDTARTTASVESNIYRLSIAWTINGSPTVDSESVFASATGSSSTPVNNSLRLRFHLCTRTRKKIARKRVVLTTSENKPNNNHNYEHRQFQQQQPESLCEPLVIEEEVPHSRDTWLSDRLSKILITKRYFMNKQTDTSASNETSEWSSIFYDCDVARWFVAYRALILEPIEDNLSDDDTADDQLDDQEDVDIDKGQKAWYRVKGVITAHVDVSGTDINQCEK